MLLYLNRTSRNDKAVALLGYSSRVVFLAAKVEVHGTMKNGKHHIISPAFSCNSGWALLMMAFGAGCGGEDLNLPHSDDGTSGTCEDYWHDLDGGLVSPDSCMIWSEKSDKKMDWHAAVSPAEADDGDCGTDCDNSNENHCVELDPVDGFGQWFLPTLAQLEDLSVTSPPFDDLDGDLWSRDSDENHTQLAWTAQLDQPGMTVTMGKTSALWVRCAAALKQ